MGSGQSRRAFRRFQLAKRKTKITKELVRRLRDFPYIQHTKPPPQVIGYRARTRCPCSCWRCGNPRKYWKERSYQEKKADLDERDERTS